MHVAYESELIFDRFIPYRNDGLFLHCCIVGVDVNAQEDIEGRTPLMLACQLGHLNVVPVLLKHDGEDVLFLSNNNGGKTAFDAPRNAETT